jgi:hypothetical protein
MKIFRTAILAGSASLLAALASVAPAQAITMPELSVPPQQSDVIKVHGHHGGHHDHWHHRGHPWHGYDGYYDDDEGSGMLFKSFVTGTLFRRGAGQASAYDNHQRSCASRYRSYSAADNSYQPNNGPRRQCR